VIESNLDTNVETNLETNLDTNLEAAGDVRSMDDRVSSRCNARRATRFDDAAASRIWSATPRPPAGFRRRLLL
jgi:hypothetical protein